MISFNLTIATDNPAVAPIATIARHFGAPTYANI